MRDRCDLPKHGECSCIASGVSCKVQTPIYLILEEATVGAAKYGTRDLILLSIIVIAIIFGFGVSVEPVNV